MAEEDGKQYAGISQDMGPLMDRVRYLDAKVNGATAQENKRGQKYIGSIPNSVLIEWLHRHGHTYRDWLINADGCKDKFKKYILQPEFRRFLAHDAKRYLA